MRIIKVNRNTVLSKATVGYSRLAAARLSQRGIYDPIFSKYNLPDKSKKCNLTYARGQLMKGNPRPSYRNRTESVFSNGCVVSVGKA